MKPGTYHLEVDGIRSVKHSKIQSFRVDLDPKFTEGHEFVELGINEETNSFTARMYDGEVYSHSWGAPGDDFIKFLIRIFNDSDYLYDKLSDSRLEDFVDIGATMVAMHTKIINARGNYEYNMEQARNAFDWVQRLERFNRLDKEALNHLYSPTALGEPFAEESWDEETIVYAKDTKAYRFCFVVAPILSKMLAYYYAPRYAPYGGRPTLMHTLPVGTKFYVHNGCWKGQIVEKDNFKHLKIGNLALPLTDDYSLDISIEEEQS